ncbi:MAG: class I SAM-dependent rRNA methyltransferase [Ilumatobacteraceae bacterium]
MTPTLTLRPNRERSLLRRHPWVFSGAVASVTGDPAPGDTVVVRSSTGESLGCAAYSPASQIRARMWSFTDTEIDELGIVVRIAAAVQRRAALGSITDACRLVFSEADDLPGVIADRYGDVVVCQLTTAGAERWREPIADALAALGGVACVYERSDAEVRQREGLTERTGVLRGALPDGELVITEHGLRSAVDVVRGHKTGFYLDQRDARWLVGVMARGRRVLNVFSYTGSMGVAAARGGAESVCSIDSSAPALAVARHNADLNGVDVGEIIEGDAFAVLRTLRDRARHFDLILLDPPKLAATEAQVSKATRAYKDLNLLAVKLLAPGGTLLTWSCSGAMTMDLFQKVVAGAALDSRRQARLVGRLHQPLDHPIPLSFPEAEYLKGLILHAD